MIKLQYGRWGEDWEDSPSEWPSEWLARNAIEKEGFEDLTDLVAEGKFWYRLVDENDNVLEVWRPMPYIGAPYIAMMSENPFNELQEDYGFSDEEMIELCQRYLKAKAA